MNALPWSGLKDWEMYCPVCGRVLDGTEGFEEPEVERLRAAGGPYLFLHDKVVHDDDDIVALQLGVQ